MSSHPHLTQVRTLIIALFLSGTLNILLLAFTFFFAFWERPPTPYCELKPKVDVSLRTISVSPTNADLLSHYKAFTYEQLVKKLAGTRFVEDGFKERDLALAVLTTFHDFDLERALGNHSPPIQKRILSFKEGQEKVIAYPSLSDEQFSTLQAFIKIERWPFKSRGLFLLMKTEQYQDEPTLSDAFAMTSEFMAVESLFKKVDVSREDLLKIIQEGGWGMLSTFYEKQKSTQDLSDENRQRFLLTYLKMGSKTSARVLLKTDFQFVAKRLSDATILSILRFLESPEPLALQFLSAIAASPRGDEVRTLAESRHLEWTGKPWAPLASRGGSVKPIQQVIPFKTKVAVSRGVVSVPSPKVKGKSETYVVQEGDSLWKIGRRFKVPVEKIRAYNGLTSDLLKRGTPLKIPFENH